MAQGLMALVRLPNEGGTDWLAPPLCASSLAPPLDRPSRGRTLHCGRLSQDSAPRPGLRSPDP